MTPDLAARLLAAGLSPAESEQKSGLFRLAARRLQDWAGKAREDRFRCFVPGRIEVLGKHTDYAGGRSLLCAVERGICALAAPRADSTVRIADARREQECEFSISTDLDPRSEHWPIYPRTVARRLARNFPGPLHGMDMVFASDLPRASGMSSSSALLVCVYLLLEKRNDLRRRTEYQENIRNLEEEAAYLACIENGQTCGSLEGDAGVGTFGGSEDHTAILCSRPGRLRQYSFCPTRFEAEVSLRPEYVFLIANCGVAADKTGTAREQYNHASGAAREILKIWNEATGRVDPSLFAAATHAQDAPARIREVILSSGSAPYSAQDLLNRLDQFIEECLCIIPGAISALQANDMEAFGWQVKRSQTLAEQQLGNQIPQTIELAHAARRLGAIAASAFGAGFGGSVWAMARAEQAPELLTQWEEHYQNKFPTEAQKGSFFMSGAGPGALVL
jgi:galactokinase